MSSELFYNDTIPMEQPYSQSPPRCSTPIFDPCVGARPVPEYIPRCRILSDYDSNENLYYEWKKRLHRPKGDHFKVRGPGKCSPRGNARGIDTPKNCSIISGYLQLVVERISEATIVRPAPLYQMWVPVTYPAVWGPAPTCHPTQSLPPWYGTSPLGAPASSPFFAPPQHYNYPVNDHYAGYQQLPNFPMYAPQFEAPKCQNMQYNAHYVPPPLPPLRHLYYQYPAFMAYPSTQPGNVPSLYPVMMTS